MYARARGLRIRYNEWIEHGRKLHDQRALEAHEAGGGDGDSDDKGGGGGGGDDGAGGDAAGGDAGDGDEGVLAPWMQPVPLDLIDPNVSEQMNAAHAAIAEVKPAIQYYLLKYAFPRCLKYHRTKLQASGLDLGSNCLFDTRLGFSGTPSNLLAPSLVPCAFQPGTQAKVLNVLLNPNILRLKRHKGAWSPKDLLKMLLAEGHNALIDTGALITGFDNRQVAQYMMRNDRADRFDAAVFIDRTGERVYITKTNLEEGKKIALCGVPLHKRFTFYDQAHTTGTDIKQHTAARALATVNKGVIFRDHCQVRTGRGMTRARAVVDPRATPRHTETYD